MKTFGKSHKLDHVCYDLRGPIMDEAMRMERAGEKILKLNIGNPAYFGFKTPEPIVRVMAANLPLHEGYTDSLGIMAAREAIAGYCREKGIPNVTVDDIYTGNGVSELITMSMQGLLDNGDEVLVPSPDYPLWTASVTLAGGRAVHYLCDESSNWYPDLKDMAGKITDRTKGIVVINPNNPTGVLYPKEVLEQIVQLAREHELILFADEIYDRLVMDGEHTALASLAPDLLTVSLNGLSKSHLAAGFRCGWMCLAGDKSRAKGYIQGLHLLGSMRLCSNAPAQSIIPAALADKESTRALLVPGGRVYEQRECVCRMLTGVPGLSFVRPQAAFYIFPKLDMGHFHMVDDERFALDLLKQKKILLTHGKGFHWEQPDHFRIVFLSPVDELAKACQGLVEFLADYRQG